MFSLPAGIQFGEIYFGNGITRTNADRYARISQDSLNHLSGVTGNMPVRQCVKSVPIRYKATDGSNIILHLRADDHREPASNHIRWKAEIFQHYRVCGSLILRGFHDTNGDQPAIRHIDRFRNNVCGHGGNQLLIGLPLINEHKDAGPRSIDDDTVPECASLLLLTGLTRDNTAAVIDISNADEVTTKRRRHNIFFVDEMRVKKIPCFNQVRK